jgi:light-regulated signal transduction histidine kinase (bacteriophytochrome)
LAIAKPHAAQKARLVLTLIAAAPNPDPAAATPARAQRLLEALHPVCSHDLPNQVVALQSLLQLFQWDEAAHLTPQGLEYFGRLQSIAGKTFALVQFLKEMARLSRHVPHWEKLVFANLVEELQAETRRVFPEEVCTWECRWQVESVTADRRLVYHGVMHLLRALLAGRRTAMTVRLESAPQEQQVFWTIEALPQGPTTSVSPGAETASFDERLELALAQETLAASDIACRPAASAPAGGAAFHLLIPARMAHG